MPLVGPDHMREDASSIIVVEGPSTSWSGVSAVSSPEVRQRRREPRIAPLDDRVWMQWWDGDEYFGLSARLVNVSRHGAMIVTMARMRIGLSVRIYLEEPSPQVGVDATVLGVVEGVHGVHQIRLGFRGECPIEFLDAAANGFEAWLACDRG